jgi:histidyl-tRNA synthetase
MKHEKIGDHIKNALKLSIPFFVAFGDNERNAGAVTLKNLVTESEEVIPMDNLASHLLG